MIVCMQKMLTSSHTATIRILATSLIIATLSHIMIWATYGRRALLYIPLSSEMSSVTKLFAAFMPLLLCLVVIGLVGYMLLRRKIAAAAAIITALSISMLSHVAMLAQGKESVLVLSLLATVGSVIFGGFYLLLTSVRRPKLISAILFGATVVLSLVVSTIVLYIIRVNQPI